MNGYGAVNIFISTAFDNGLLIPKLFTASIVQLYRYPAYADPGCRTRLVAEALVVLPVKLVIVAEFVLVQVAKYSVIAIPPELIDGGVKFKLKLVLPVVKLVKLTILGAGTLQAVAVEPGTHGCGGT